MKALVLDEAGGIDAARLTEVPARDPGHGEVRVTLRAAALNHRELWIVRGQYPGMKLPAILGADGAGIITEVGAGVDPARIGSEVVLYPAMDWGPNPAGPSPAFALLGMPHDGTLAETVVVPADHAVTKPTFLSFEEAAALAVAGLTAWRALTVKAALRSGEKLLVTGIGGGVAGYAMLFGKALGATVFVTSGSSVTLEKAVAAGAEQGFDYKADGWGKALGKTSGGIDVVVDGAPATALPAYMRALAIGARVVIYGSTGGHQFTTSAPDLFLRHAAIFGTAMGTLDDFRAMLAFVDREQIRPIIDRTFAFDEAVEALTYLENAHGFGKVVVSMPF